jgi:hypothetical protein
MPKTTEVQTKTAASPAAITDMTTIPAHINAESGRGNENVGGELQIPRLKQLQKASNEVDKHHPDFIGGAEVGDWIDTVTKNVLGQSVKVVSVNFLLNFVVWKNRAVGGGAQKLGEFKTAEEANAAVESQDQQEFEKDGVKVPYWTVSKSHKHLVLAFDADDNLLPTPYIMDFSGSKITPSNNWNTKISALAGDRFASVWEIKSNYVTKGENGWYNIDAEGPKGWLAENHYKVAEELYKSTTEF